MTPSSLTITTISMYFDGSCSDDLSVDQINRDDAFYINEEEVPNTLSTIFNIQVVQEPAKVATFGSGIGTNAIDNSGHLDGQCRIIYKNLRGGSPSGMFPFLDEVNRFQPLSSYLAKSFLQRRRTAVLKILILRLPVCSVCLVF